MPSLHAGRLPALMDGMFLAIPIVVCVMAVGLLFAPPPEFEAARVPSRPSFAVACSVAALIGALAVVVFR